MKRFLFSFSLILFAIALYQFNKHSDQPNIKIKEPVNKHYEKFYQTQFCNDMKGEMEVILEDRTRVDCLTDEYAIEVDFAKKWAESIGQSLFYAEITSRKPAIVLIIGKKDQRYITRLKRVTDKLNIKVFLINKVD
jgi:hypothetical protein